MVAPEWTGEFGYLGWFMMMLTRRSSCLPSALVLYAIRRLSPKSCAWLQ